jgi:saccharopine dehydrogenase-like NADP-dependent oxidoreductase
MAKTVGLPIAVAAKLLLEGQIKERGVQIPVHPDIYEPVLDELENLGITFREYEVARQPA